MAALGPYLRSVDWDGAPAFGHWCPGCECAHIFITGREKHPVWTFDGNADAPTFSPSMRSFVPADEEAKTPEITLCHYVLTAGIINFLSESTGHALRGAVPLPPFPADYRLE
jgi:hypothetical protein